MKFRLGYSASDTGPWTWGSYDSSIDTTANYYVKVELETVAGVDSVTIACIGGDEVTMASLPTVTPDVATKTGIFRMPNSESTVIVRCRINAGIDINGESVVEYTKKLAAHVVSANGYRLLAVDETDETNRNYGYVAKLNAIIRYVPGAIPVGTLYQHMEHSGTQWYASNNVVLPSGDRKIKANSGNITIQSQDVADDVVFWDPFAYENLRVVYTGPIVGGAGNDVGFYGVTPVARQTVNWDGSEGSSLIHLLEHLVDHGIIDGACV